MLVSQRKIVGLLIFCGLITNYMLRVNISIAIVTMVQKDSNSSSQSVCVETNTTDEGDDDGGTKLDWTGEEVSWVLLSFFIGYAAFQVSKLNSIIIIQVSTILCLRLSSFQSLTTSRID